MQILSRLTLCCFILTSCLPAFALGTAFTYQGRLNDGTNLATGSYDLRFAIYDADSGGAQQGNLITNPATALNNGLFTVTLDFGNQFPGADRWLEIGVRTNGEEGFTTLWPRQALTPAPYALFAATANTLNGTLPAAQVTGLPTTNDYATHLYASNIAQEVYSSMSAISGYATRSQASNIAQEVYSLISGNIKFVGGESILATSLKLGHPPKTFYVVGCSTSVQAGQRDGTNGTYTFGGVTNRYSPIREPDGRLFSTVGTFAENNLFWGQVVTNILGTNGVDIKLDNDICYGGQSFGNIIGGNGGYGYQSWQNDVDHQLVDTNYTDDGTWTNNISALTGEFNTWWRDAESDTSVTVQETNYTCAVGTNVTFFVTGAHLGDAPIIYNGIPGAKILSKITHPIFAGAQFGYPYPHKAGGTATTNLSDWPISWLYTNSPNLTGVPAGLFVYDPQNDFASGVIRRAANVPYVETNFMSVCTVGKSLGYTPVIVMSTPLTYGFFSSGTLNRGGTNMNMFNTWLAANWPKFADAYVPLAEIYTAAGLTNCNTNYFMGNGCDAHDNTNGANFKAGLIVNALGLKYLAPSGITSLPFNFSSGQIYTNTWTRPIELKNINVIGTTVSGVAGFSQQAFCVYGVGTNYSPMLSTSATVATIDGTVTNTMNTSIIIPPGGGFTLTNISTGAGNFSTITGGRIIIY